MLRMQSAQFWNSKSCWPDHYDLGSALEGQMPQPAAVAVNSPPQELRPIAGEPLSKAART